jgi:hypothetical protein
MRLELGPAAPTAWAARLWSGGMNHLRPPVFRTVERVEGNVAWVRDEDGVVRPGPNDREHKVGDLVKLVLADDGSVLRVLDT